MVHLIGDVQGCCDALDRLLAEIGFSPSRDRLVLLGDLVNRGPQSLASLHRVRGLGNAVTCLLGNHDLHFLAVAHGLRRMHRTDTLAEILAAPDCAEWVEWVRQRPLACVESGWLCVHAGVVPQWDTARTLDLCAEVEAMLTGPDLEAFLRVMYGNEPRQWSESLQGVDRWRFVINTLTRIRFCTADGLLEFGTKEGVGGAPEGYLPWFDVPGRRTRGQPIAFGHWSTLGLIDQPELLAIDTGCLWGGTLTAVRVDGGRREVLQVRCDTALEPGIF